MTINMNDSHMVSISQIKEFIKVANSIQFQGASRKEKYAWIEEILLRFRYFSLKKKKEKSIVKEYIAQITGYSDAQLTRLITRKKHWGKIVPSQTRRHTFPRRYTTSDIALLIETDKAHDRLSGKATKRIFEREHGVFDNKTFERLKDISVAHIYNLRETRQYTSHARFFTKTRPTPTNIGERRKPDPNGTPGFLRVDTVHQGDYEKEKGVYHINIVDEVTQWEVVGAVEKISEYHLKPLLEDLIHQFPFRIKNFHSDNGSEYINKVVAELLNKLLIGQTKSRARHCNDNALVEGKNGSVIRKHMGYLYIHQKYASTINQFYKTYLNEYLNYHRPCGFATTIINEKGKQKKVYDTYQTPYEKLKSLENAKQFLKEKIAFEMLDKTANEKSDNECAALMQKAKAQLFKNIHNKLRFPTTRSFFISGSSLD
jgi:transposase InsO family protein